MTARAMPISTLALYAVFICISCAGPGGASSDASAERPESPVHAHLVRACEKVEASGEPRILEELPDAVEHSPVRIAPAGSHFGFAGDGKNVVYTFPKGGSLYAVSPDGGQPLRLANEVSYWFEASQAGELIYDSGGTRYRVGMNGAKPRPAPEASRDEFAGWSNFYVSPDGEWLLFRRGTPPQKRRDSPESAEGNGLYILALP